MQVDATQKAEVEFSTLGPGDPFWYNTHLCMRIDLGAGASYNCARVDTGTGLNLTPAIKVAPADVKVVDA